THHGVEVRAAEGEVSYFNSGSWTELPCQYLTVRNGQIRLHEYVQELAAERVDTPVETRYVLASS
ncbi:MAG: UDP-2,3-diacylglucosamine diphosphatase, partial [Gemmataceae bacterium]